ncbi:MAG: hypothetical protein KGM24_00305 [Elusimicrobia bacterium]|nr:hypothetical protein [Elusimicrobiota bacterium]
MDTFDKAVDVEGFIVEKSNPKQRVLTRDGEEVRVEDFAGIKKGSLLFFKKDLPSLITLSDLMER